MAVVENDFENKVAQTFKIKKWLKESVLVIICLKAHYVKNIVRKSHRQPSIEDCTES